MKEPNRILFISQEISPYLAEETPNQINNVIGFPYIFRGALDVHATAIN